MRSSFTIASSGDLTALGAEGKEEEKREINNSDANGFDITGFKTQNSDNCSDREEIVSTILWS